MPLFRLLDYDAIKVNNRARPVLHKYIARGLRQLRAVQYYCYDHFNLLLLDDDLFQIPIKTYAVRSRVSISCFIGEWRVETPLESGEWSFFFFFFYQFYWKKEREKGRLVGYLSSSATTTKKKRVESGEWRLSRYKRRSCIWALCTMLGGS